MPYDDDPLKDWATLTDAVQNMTEQELVALLKRAKKEKRSVSFLLRIYGRYNKLRTQRERTELVAGVA